MHPYTRNLQFDRRLARRPNWTPAGEWDDHLRDLPDAAEKATTVGDVEDAEAAAEPRDA